jgi:hypothetical protein
VRPGEEGVEEKGRREGARVSEEIRRNGGVNKGTQRKRRRRITEINIQIDQRGLGYTYNQKIEPITFAAIRQVSRRI